MLINQTKQKYIWDKTESYTERDLFPEKAFCIPSIKNITVGFLLNIK